MSTVSVVLLTWNRASTLKQCMEITLKNAGRKWDEFIWVDNGSEQIEEMKAIMKPYGPMTQVFYPKNTGMQRGFNTCFSMPRTDYVVAIGPDLIMPEGWLEIFMTYVEKIPQTGLATIYTVPIENVPERYRNGKKEIEYLNGLPILRAMPMEVPIIKREIFSHVGYYREDFGLYAWGDVEWTLRCERILPGLGYESYVIPGVYVNHLGSEGATEFKLGLEHGDTREYWEWKKGQSEMASNHALMHKCHQENYKFYSPF